MTLSAPPWPLPNGHVFGPPIGSAHYHDGRGVLDSLQLRKWENAYCGIWRRPRYRPTGLYNAQTQAAVCEVQQRLGLPLTGLLGPSEWAAVWEVEPPLKPEEPVKQVSPLTKYAREMKRKQIREYWQRYSKWKVRFGSDPNAPAWFPGRPFGPHEVGPHVERVRELFGFKPHGKYTLEVARRVRGLQRANGLPESGIVDARTASLLDPPQQVEAAEDPPP